MSLILIERIANLNGPIIPDTLNGVLNGSEIDAHKFIIKATRDGAAVALTGTVTASFLRADGAEVVLTGEIENGAATVTLAQSCYTVPGRFDLTVFVTSDGVKTGVYACTGGVRNTTSGTIVDPGQIVPSVDDIIAKQEELAQDVADASSAVTSAQNAVSYLAPVFSTSRTYAVGEYVTQDGALYICKAAVETAGAWDAAKWQTVTFGEEVTDLKSALEDFQSDILSFDRVSDSFVSINGAILPYRGWDRTGYVRCDAYSKLVINSANHSAYNCFFDANKEFISAFGLNAGKNTLVVPSSAVFFICSNTSGAMDSLVIETQQKTMRDDALTKASANGDMIDALADEMESAFETGIEFTENGFINAYGLFVENTYYLATDFINCVNGGTFVPYKYRLQMFANTKIAYYDKEKTLISVLTPSESQSLEYVEGIVPYVEGANYVRFCTAKNATGYYVKYATVKNYVANSDLTMTPCDYVGDEITVFNKILCIGDSLTSGTFNYRENGSTGHYINDVKYSYPTYLKKLTGCETTNMGHGGMSSAEWYNAYQNDDLSGYDCAIIQLGVNDRIRYTTWGETSETAFTNIINKLKAENKNIKIFVANIIPATSYSDDGYIAFSAALLGWVTSTYANDASVIPLDMQQYGHTKDSPAYNCGHLSALGYRRLAQDYKGYIGWYISKNKNVFKEVQFIGTDYYYDQI